MTTDGVRRALELYVRATHGTFDRSTVGITKGGSGTVVNDCNHCRSKWPVTSGDECADGSLFFTFVLSLEITTRDTVRNRASGAMDIANVSLDAAKGGLKWAYSNNLNNLNIPWGTLVERAVEYITAHPGSTVIQVASASFAVCPALIASPVLTWVGFSNIGPVAGSTAATYQSINGATWAFSGMQSAAMQGYALPFVHGFVQGASVLSAGVAEVLKRQ